MNQQFDVISDLHLDAHRDYSKEYLKWLQPKSPILVIAGDTFNGLICSEKQTEALRILRDKYREVVMVLGNHDHYHLDFPRTLDAFRALSERLGFICLENDVREVEGIRFAGTTLWFEDDDRFAHLRCSMSDFRLIGNFIDEIQAKNQEARDFIAGLENIDVLVTHHLPSHLSINAKYAHAENNIYYVCPIDEDLYRFSPKVAVHGHTHEPCDYLLGETRVICWPRGYPFERSEPVGVKQVCL